MSESRPPKVSVCIPTYKGAASIAATIESVLSQSFTDFELLVIDDRSPDDTVGIVSRFRDPRIRYVVNDTTLGAIGNWNRCLQLARGEYYKLLPHDDLLARECLREQAAALDADREGTVALVFGWRQVIDAAGRPLMRRGLVRSTAQRMNRNDLIRRCIRSGTNLIGEPGSGLMRLALARRLGTYASRHPYVVDLDFWVRALSHGDGHHTGTCSSSFRLSTTSWSYAIGRRQYADFAGFLQECEAVREGGVTRADITLGMARARLNMSLRLLLYRFMRGESDHRPPRTNGDAMRSNPDSSTEFGHEYAAAQLARRENRLRRFVKSFYVARVLRHAQGRTVDVGCGAGPILERLPAGSVGIEVNPVLVSELRARGLDVRTATPDGSRIDLSAVASERFQTLVLSHVLEHFEAAHQVLRRLLADAAALGVQNVIIIVPGWAGYESDATHKTFVTMEYLRRSGVLACEGFRLREHSYFPGNAEWIGRHFVYHELMLVYGREVAARTAN